MKLFNELSQRGLISQTTSEEVESLLNGNPISFYCGFDPTSDSLHIGSLLPLTMIKRLQKSGHNALIVLGNATAMIGDPSGKSAERVMLNGETIEKNLQGLKKQISGIVEDKSLFLENLDWFKEISFIDFLRTVGKNFSVNSMLAKDSVKSRLENREQGISFTEFSYMLLQAEDFRHLFETHNCVLEIGGSDQWSHMISGIDLIKTTTKKQAFGMTFPLLTKSDGSKFGKTEKGNIWLSEEKTSVFDFYQFFLNTADSDVIDLLKKLTFLSLDDIAVLEDKTNIRPEKREAQKALARELTVLVHGEEKFNEALAKTEALFSKNQASIEEDFQVPVEQVIDNSLVDLLVMTGLCPSKTQARKDILGGGIYIESSKVLDVNKTISDTDLKERKLILRKGKSNYKVVKII